MPFPGREYRAPYRAAQLRRYAWSSAFLSSNCRTLWSTYDTVGIATRSRSSCSNWRQAIVPVASSSRTWSTRSSISSSELPARCSEMIFSVSVFGPATARA
jgi:hypothetical protein